jgi:hypothetical protein
MIRPNRVEQHAKGVRMVAYASGTIILRNAARAAVDAIRAG